MSSEHDKAILNSIFNPLLPVGEHIYHEELPEMIQDVEEETDCVKESKSLEAEGVKCAESGDVDNAICLFTQAIEVAPNRASGYNNRAQAYRLKGNITDALVDLDKAILLSGGVGRSGCQAFCQRGIILRRQGQDELASENFQAAAQLGSNFAKAQSVQLNPYAALCNKMLHDVMTKLQTVENT